jgi:hypothetical protein
VVIVFHPVQTKSRFLDEINLSATLRTNATINSCPRQLFVFTHTSDIINYGYSCKLLHRFIPHFAVVLRYHVYSRDVHMLIYRQKSPHSVKNLSSLIKYIIILTNATCRSLSIYSIYTVYSLLTTPYAIIIPL